MQPAWQSVRRDGALCIRTRPAGAHDTVDVELDHQVEDSALAAHDLTVELRIAWTFEGEGSLPRAGAVMIPIAGGAVGVSELIVHLQSVLGVAKGT